MVVLVATTMGTQLVGRIMGRKHFAQACELLAQVPPGAVVVLDFKGVQYVNGSWINSMLIPLYAWAADERNDLFFVLSRFDQDWLDDLRMVAEWYHQPCLVAVSEEQPPTQAVAVGPLDPAQRSALQAVHQIGAVTGAELVHKWPQEKVKATAWNNRLKDLFDKRLIRRRKQGREQVYFPVVKEVVFNG